MNAYFGYTSVRYCFFLGAKIWHVITCDTDRTTLFSLICDLWFH